MLPRVGQELMGLTNSVGSQAISNEVGDPGPNLYELDRVKATLAERRQKVILQQ